jgi:hypothetical protein
VLQSNCSLFTEVVGVFLLAKIDTAKKMFPDFIIILSYRSYFVFFLDFRSKSVYL